jgi:predicted hotdog family 3-hydroxylacyl-ACP dehydratase
MTRSGIAPIDQTWIAAHVPHHGRMCLLDSVQSWDQQSIHCRTSSHRAPDHPMRSHGRLGAACLIEYAAQAIAVHGALLQGPHALPASPVTGMLASARSLELLVASIESIEGDLAIQARRQHADGRGALYDFEVRAGSAEALIARGRLSVVLEAPATGPP